MEEDKVESMEEDTIESTEEKKLKSKKSKFWKKAAFWKVVAWVIPTTIAILAFWNTCSTNRYQTAALKAEKRPLLIIRLERGDYIDIDRKSGRWVIKDFFCEDQDRRKIPFTNPLCENKPHYLELPISWVNTQVITATGIEAYYYGPKQQKQQFVWPDQSNEIPYFHQKGHEPHINVSGYTDKDEFTTELRVKYRGIKEIDERTYTSSLKLKFEKTKGKDADRGLFFLKRPESHYDFEN